MSKDDLLFKISEDIGGIKSSIKNIEKTQQSHTDTFLELTSWKNGIITMVTKEAERRYQQVKEETKEDIANALKPYKEDLEKRSAFTSGVKKKSFDVVWKVFISISWVSTLWLLSKFIGAEKASDIISNLK